MSYKTPYGVTLDGEQDAQYIMTDILGDINDAFLRLDIRQVDASMNLYTVLLQHINQSIRMNIKNAKSIRSRKQVTPSNKFLARVPYATSFVTIFNHDYKFWLFVGFRLIDGTPHIFASEIFSLESWRKPILINPGWLNDGRVKLRVTRSIDDFHDNRIFSHDDKEDFKKVLPFLKKSILSMDDGQTQYVVNGIIQETMP